MRLRTFLFGALGGAVVFAAVTGTAHAATGSPFLLGRPNAAKSVTGLENRAGTALSLTSKPGIAPLKVSDRTKVDKLNADLVDGLDSADLALAAGRTGIVVGTSTDIDGFANTARCPDGSVATGGGGYAPGTRDYLYYSGPDFNGNGTLVPNSWFAVADGDAVAWVVCSSPRGALQGAVASLPDLRARGTTTASSTTKPTNPGAGQKPLP
jgi:hypothetical protein